MTQSTAGFSVYDVSSGKLWSKVLLVSVCMMSALASYDPKSCWFQCVWCQLWQVMTKVLLVSVCMMSALASYDPKSCWFQCVWCQLWQVMTQSLAGFSVYDVSSGTIWPKSCWFQCVWCQLWHDMTKVLLFSVCTMSALASYDPKSCWFQCVWCQLCQVLTQSIAGFSVYDVSSGKLWSKVLLVSVCMMSALASYDPMSCWFQCVWCQLCQVMTHSTAGFSVYDVSSVKLWPEVLLVSVCMMSALASHDPKSCWFQCVWCQLCQVMTHSTAGFSVYDVSSCKLWPKVLLVSVCMMSALASYDPKYCWFQCVWCQLWQVMTQSLAGFSVYDVSSGKLWPKVLLVSVCMMSALASYDPKSCWFQCVWCQLWQVMTQSRAGFSVYDVSSGKLWPKVLLVSVCMMSALASYDPQSCWFQCVWCELWQVMTHSLAGFSVYDVSSGKLWPTVLLVSVCMMSALASYDPQSCWFQCVWCQLWHDMTKVLLVSVCMMSALASYDPKYCWFQCVWCELWQVMIQSLAGFSVYDVSSVKLWPKVLLVSVCMMSVLASCSHLLGCRSTISST